MSIVRVESKQKKPDLDGFFGFYHQFISLLIHQSWAHREHIHIQYEHLLQLFYNLAKKMEKKPQK